MEALQHVSARGLAIAFATIHTKEPVALIVAGRTDAKKRKEKTLKRGFS